MEFQRIVPDTVLIRKPQKNIIYKKTQTKYYKQSVDFDGSVFVILSWCFNIYDEIT